MSFTPSVVQNLLYNFELQGCPESSSEGLSEALKTRILHVTVEELVQLGSAVMKDALSSSATDTDGTLTALLPNLKPMIQECFSVAISRFICEVVRKNSSESLVMCRQGPAPHEVLEVDKFSLSLKTEIVSEDEEKYDPAAHSAVEEQDYESDEEPGECLARHDQSVITNDAPPHNSYSLRGVRCKLCWSVFTCSNAVEMLVKHTKEMHPEEALRLLQRNNAFGIPAAGGVPPAQEPAPQACTDAHGNEMVQIHPEVFIDKRAWEKEKFKNFVLNPSRLYGYGAANDLPFVRDAALHLWGTETLVLHTVKGTVSNANKSKMDDGELAAPAPPLPGFEVRAIIGVLERRVRIEEASPPPDGVEREAMSRKTRCKPGRVHKIIGQKIHVLKRTKKGIEIMKKTFGI